MTVFVTTDGHRIDVFFDVEANRYCCTGIDLPELICEEASLLELLRSANCCANELIEMKACKNSEN